MTHDTSLAVQIDQRHLAPFYVGVAIAEAEERVFGFLWEMVSERIQGCQMTSKVVVLDIFCFHPYLGKIPILTHIFQMGWNHQPESVFYSLKFEESFF